MMPPQTPEDDMLLFLENTLKRGRAFNLPLRDVAAALRAGARVIELVRGNPKISERELEEAIQTHLRFELNKVNRQCRRVTVAPKEA